jgi:hypothetical protein
MHLLGWVTIHDTHHHIEVLRKNFVVVFLVCGFLGCYTLVGVQRSLDVSGPHRTLR